MLPVQPPAVLQPPGNKSKPSKGIKGYPDGWQQVLNSAKDVVRASILLKNPFPGSSLARVVVNECFYEAFTTECNTNGVIVESGMSPPPGSIPHQIFYILTKNRIFVVRTNGPNCESLIHLWFTSQIWALSIVIERNFDLSKRIKEARQDSRRVRPRTFPITSGSSTHLPRYDRC